MKNIYYDTVENFINDFEKRTGKEVILNKEKNEIIIDNEIVSFREENVGMRSFSVPYFVDNQTIIKYDGNDNK